MLGQAQTEAATTAGQPAMIPQFGDLFLDRLIDMSRQQVDIEYRQELTDQVIEAGHRVATLGREVAYYGDLSARLEESSNGRSGLLGGREQMAATIEARTRAMFDEVSKAIDQVGAIYDELSAYNLNPNSLLYEIEAPFREQVDRSVSMPEVALGALLVFAVSLFLVPLAFMTYAYFRREIRQS